MKTIPFVNLSRQISSLKSELMQAIEGVIDSKAFILGSATESFESKFSEMQQTAFTLGCSNGTSAIRLALEALGISRGDEVIVQTNTFIATAEAVCNLGATPVFVDIIGDDYSISIDSVRKHLTPKTKAIIPVHLYGVPCSMDAILALAKGHNLKVVEDCAQAHLATYNGSKVGTFGDLGTFSFFPGKNLGAFGDAGAIVGKNKDHYEALVKLRNHGRTDKYLHDMVGYNERIDGIQSAVLSVKLPHLAKWTKRRQEVAKMYDEYFKSAGIKTITPPANAISSYHLYVIEVSKRDWVQQQLSSAGIETGVHYPVPLHLQPAFSYMPKKKLPVAEAAAERILSLPICGDIEDSEVKYVAETLLNVVAQ